MMERLRSFRSGRASVTLRERQRVRTPRRSAYDKWAALAGADLVRAVEAAVSATPQ
jgi:hypothetical protein